MSFRRGPGPPRLRTPLPGRQPWGYAGAFADPDGHLWMITA